MPKSLLILILLAIQFGASTWALAQNQLDSSQVWRNETSIRYHRGFLFLHRQGLEHLSEDASNGVQVDFSWQTLGKEPWHQAYNYPDVGLSLIYLDFGNPRLGNGIGLYPFYRLNFLSNPKYQWNLQMGGGLGFITEKWTRDNNYKNVMVSSNWNVCIGIQTEFAWEVSERFQLKTGASFIHFSNGSTRIPNLGINIPTVSLGVEYAFQPINTGYKKSEPWNIPNNELVLTLSGFFKTVEALGEFYEAGTARIEYGTFTKNQKNRFHGSLDIMRNGGLRREFKDESPKGYELWQLGVFAGYSIVFGKGEILMGIGSYVYAAKSPEGLIYNRAGYRYRWNDKWMANIVLKTHFFKADYFEFGIARQLWKN